MYAWLALDFVPLIAFVSTRWTLYDGKNCTIGDYALGLDIGLPYWVACFDTAFLEGTGGSLAFRFPTATVVPAGRRMGFWQGSECLVALYYIISLLFDQQRRSLTG